MTEYTIMQAVYETYLAALAVIGLGAILLSTGPLRRTAAAMVLNCAANILFVLLTGIESPWLWYVVTDGLAARVILHQPAGRAQSAIGWVYMAQILMHGVYAVSDHALAANPYWQILMSLALVQLLILGGWVIGRGGRHFGLGGGADRSGLAHPEGTSGLAT